MGSYDVASLLAQYEDAPSAEPMHGQLGQVRRNPSTDQKKVRRGMSTSNQKTASEGQPELTETELLRKAASAETLDEQTSLMAQYEQVRTASLHATAADRELDLSIKEAVEIVPRGLHELHTASTDWLMHDNLEVTASAQDAEQALVAEAMMWFERCPDEVKSYPDEFRVQASNLAHRVASQYGDHAPAAEQAFLTEADRLWRQGQRSGAIKTASIDDPTRSNPGGTPTRSRPAEPEGNHVNTEFPGTHDLGGHTPHLNNEIGAHMSGEDAAGVGEHARSFADFALRGGSLQATAARQAEDTEMSDALAGFSHTAGGLNLAEGGEAGAAMQGVGEVSKALDGVEHSLDSGSDGVGQAADSYAKQVTSASGIPQTGLHPETFPTGFGAYPDIDTSSMRSPAMQELQDYQGWDGSSVVPQGISPAAGMNADGEPGKDFAADPNNPGKAFPNPTHAAKVASQLQRTAADSGHWSGWPMIDHPNSMYAGEQIPSCPACGSNSTSQVGVHGPGGRMGDPGGGTKMECHNCGHSKYVPHTSSLKESAMQHQAACPTCSGSGHVAVRHQAYSGLPQIDQIVNADETPGNQPAPGQSENYPSQVAFQMNPNWGNGGDVQNAIAQTEQQLAERNQKSSLMSGTASRHHALAPDNSGWLGNTPVGPAPGGKGQRYDGNSSPVGYDGSSSTGYVDPVYGQGGDNGDQPLMPYGEMEAHDVTNNPPQPYDPSSPHNADQAWRQTAGEGAITTQGSYHPDPRIAAQQHAILQAQANIRALTQQGR